MAPSNTDSSKPSVSRLPNSRKDEQMKPHEAQILTYPVIMHESNDEDGYYFTVTSPNISGMVTQGEDRKDAEEEAVDAIATMLDGAPYPKAQDPTNWHLEPNEAIAYITVDMAKWYKEKEEAGIDTHTVTAEVPNSDPQQDINSQLPKGTRKALNDADHPERLHHYDSTDEMWQDLDV